MYNYSLCNFTGKYDSYALILMCLYSVLSIRLREGYCIKDIAFLRGTLRSSHFYLVTIVQYTGFVAVFEIHESL